MLNVTFILNRLHRQLNNKRENQYSEQPLMSNPNAVLPGALVLLKSAILLYKKKIRVISGIILPVLLITILSDRSITIKFINNYSVIYNTIAFIFHYLIIFWSTAALLLVIKNEAENVTAIGAYRQSGKRLALYILLAILSSFIITGGFLLAVIPGLIFLIWFSFANIILIIEGESIVTSLLKSKEYARNYWLSIAWRHIFIIVVAAFLATFISIAIIDSIILLFGFSSNPVHENYISLFIAPLIIIYSFLVYKSLRCIKQEVKTAIILLRTKIIFLIAGAIGMPIMISLLILGFLVYAFASDIPSPDDSDLRLSKVFVVEEDNAFYNLDKIKDDIMHYPSDQSDLINDYVENKKWDEEFIADLLSRNELVLSYLDQAKAKPKFQNPSTHDPTMIGQNILNPMLFINMATLDSLRSLYLFKRGQEQLALDNAMQLVLLAQKIHNSQSGLLYYLTARPLKNIGLTRIIQIVTDSEKLSSDLLANHVLDLNSIENTSGLKKAFIMEYLNRTNEISPINNVQTSYFFKPNKLKQLLIKDARMIMSSVEAHCTFNMTSEFLVRFDEHKQFLSSVRSVQGFIKTIFSDNIIGKTAYHITVIMINPDGMRLNKCNDDVVLSAVRSLLALKAHEIDHNDLPSSLDELVPQYVSKVPLDPFDGKPIKYSKDKKIIYSVGEDGIDSGGSAGDDWRKMPDPTFSVDFAPSAPTEAL